MTVMSIVPVPGGLVALIWVAEFTVKLEAALLPKSTTVAPMKLAPVIVTPVPPLLAPEPGVTPVTTGDVVVDGGEAFHRIAPPMLSTLNWPSELRLR